MPTSWNSIVSLVLMGIFLAWVIWMGQRRGKNTPARNRMPSSDDLTGRDRLQKAMEDLQVNVMEFGRDVEARLDTKIRTLGRLVQDADDRIKRLEELRGAGMSAGETPPIHREIYRLADSGVDNIEISRRTGVAPGEVELILGLRRARNG